MESSGFGKRLWRKDAGLWKQDPDAQKMICRSMGWLHVAEKMVHHVPHLQELAIQVIDAGFSNVVHMGMGGSSLRPLCFSNLSPTGKHGLPLRVLDTTDPATILKIDARGRLSEDAFHRGYQVRDNGRTSCLRRLFL